MTARAAFAAALAVVALAAAGCTLGGDAPTRVVAEFDRTSNLFEGSEVRVLGLEVGEVATLTPRGDIVEVEMLVDADQPLPADVSAEVKPSALLGERFVQLDPAYTGGPQLADGAVIERDRTSQPAEIDEVLASFEHFLDSLDRDALANLIDALAGTLEGQGEGLNELVDEGSQTMRVLADAGDDLNAVVAEIGDLNETLATRDERIGDTLTELSTTLTILAEERDHIIGTVAELHRLTAELRPLLDDHGDALVADLEQLATTLSTVDRNLDRLGDTALGAHQLFAGIGEAVDFERARLNLHNETEDLSALLAERLVQRVVGLCLRLEVEECADAGVVGDLLWDTVEDRDQLVTELGDVIAGLIAELPEEAQEGLDTVPGLPHADDGDDATPPSQDSAPPPDPSDDDEPDVPGVDDPPGLDDVLDDLLGGGS